MFLAIVTVGLYVLGSVQVLGGILGVIVALVGLTEIKRRVAALPATEYVSAGEVRIHQRKGLTILRRAVLALILGLAVLTVAAWVTVVTA